MRKPWLTFLGGILILVACATTGSFSPDEEARSNPIAPLLSRYSCQIHEDKTGILHARGETEIGALLSGWTCSARMPEGSA